MLIDGCFILELLRSGSTENSNWFDPREPIFCRMRKLTITLGFRDMLLLENQIPLLVLKKLLEAEFGMEIDDRYLNRLICTFYGFGSLQIDGPSLRILDIRRKCLIMAMPTKEQTTPSVANKSPNRETWDHEAGIEFKRAKPGSGLKITFDRENGVLTLPFIYMEDNTAAMYMNLMAFERMHPKLTENNAVTSYVSFMDSLIHTAEDVSLLCSQGMMMNFLSSDEDAANVFNKLGDGIIDCRDDELYKQLQSYVASNWNAARAYLKRNYFQNPWSILSLLAAIALLVKRVITDSLEESRGS
ncbi:UPF0481 protein [Nymphaea thermarum]|nr:UPF0481 protein [Nymphaea thermarum]